MAKSLRERVVASSPWKIILLAMALLIVGELILTWQYRRLEEGRIADLEKRIEEQEQTIEERAAQESLRVFLEARAAGDEIRAGRYITEGAALQLQQRIFEFSGVQDYVIQDKERLDEETFRFQVEITRDRLKQIEFIEVRKIGEDYYINSVQVAG